MIKVESCGDLVETETYSDNVFGGLELPEGDIDGDTTLTLGL